MYMFWDEINAVIEYFSHLICIYPKCHDSF